jgi:hypothetical protein
MPGPVAKFSFNDRRDYDEINGVKAKLMSVSFTRDRFENKDNALYFYGDVSSYVNLGNYKSLKPKTGTISLWVKIESEVWAGKGRYMNPIILTKNSTRDDFYEAYYMCYFPDVNKVAAFCTQDSLHQVVITGIENFEIFTWHHLAMTYDNQSFSFYVDGKLEKKLPKNFETKFLESDSVILGVTANKKNNRFLQGAIDDLEFYDKVLTAEEVSTLYNAPNPNRLRVIFNWSLVVLAIFIVITAIYFFVRYRLSLTLKKEKERLELYNIVLGTELRVNRALMNPHFVFNSLNTLHNFILANENDNASGYLIKFSKLIRKILENNMQDFISLTQEIELLEGYLEIENLRFEKDIKYKIYANVPASCLSANIPVMMLQPFVENAIWHGLLDKVGEKTLTISFSVHEAKYICCIIEDNGIGRKTNESVTEGKKSLATNFVIQRLSLLNKLHNLDCSLVISDKPNNTGTIIKITLPILNENVHA